MTCRECCTKRSSFLAAWRLTCWWQKDLKSEGLKWNEFFHSPIPRIEGWILLCCRLSSSYLIPFLSFCPDPKMATVLQSFFPTGIFQFVGSSYSQHIGGFPIHFSFHSFPSFQSWGVLPWFLSQCLYILPSSEAQTSPPSPFFYINREFISILPAISWWSPSAKAIDR